MSSFYAHLVLVASGQAGYGVDPQCQQQLQTQAANVRQFLPLATSGSGSKTVVQQLSVNQMVDSSILPGVASNASFLSPVVLVTQLNPEVG